MTSWTTNEPVLGSAEVVSSFAAVVISTVLYLREGEAYLARGVVGDLVGLAVLGRVLQRRRARMRHEALICLAGISVVRALRPGWPLRVSSATWWLALAVALTGYVGARRSVLSRARPDG